MNETRCLKCWNYFDYDKMISEISKVTKVKRIINTQTCLSCKLIKLENYKKERAKQKEKHVYVNTKGKNLSKETIEKREFFKRCENVSDLNSNQLLDLKKEILIRYNFEIKANKVLCKKCNSWVDIDKFSFKKRDGKFNHNGKCKDCEAKYQRELYKKNSKAFKRATYKWISKNKERNNKNHRDYYNYKYRNDLSFRQRELERTRLRYRKKKEN